MGKLKEREEIGKEVGWGSPPPKLMIPGIPRYLGRKTGPPDIRSFMKEAEG